MPDSHDFFSGDEGKLQEILMKISEYQRSLADGRAVELEELQRQGIRTPADLEFMSTHSVTYKPHRVSDHHAMDMLYMPTEDGGCVFIGPNRQPPMKRRIALKDLGPIVRDFLNISRPEDELLLFIELAKDDGVGVSPKMIGFVLQNKAWLTRLPALRSVAAEFGLRPFQDGVVQGSHILDFEICDDPERTTAVVVALLGRGCGLADASEVVYSAGALDEA